MKIKDILKKIAEGTELTDEEKAFAESYEEPDVNAAANAKAKKEREKSESKLAEMLAEIEALKEANESAQAGGTEAEKMAKTIEKLNQQLEAEKASRTEAEAAHLTTQRESALNGLPIKFLDSVKPDLKKTVLGSFFADMDLDDLGNESLVNAKVTAFAEEYAPLISSDVQGGAGTKPGIDGTTKPAGGSPVVVNKDSNYEDLRKQLDSKWAEAEIKVKEQMQ